MAAVWESGLQAANTSGIVGIGVGLGVGGGGGLLKARQAIRRQAPSRRIGQCELFLIMVGFLVGQQVNPCWFGEGLDGRKSL